MSLSGIQGRALEVTVVGCTKLRDTEWISRQDPYVCVEYGSTKFRTRTCTDGGKNPSFQEKFIFTLIEGLWEINVQVWNSNTLTMDDLIGSGRILLQKVLHEGYDGSSWTLQSKNGRYAGEVSLILHYPNLNKHQHNQTMPLPPYPQSTYQVPYCQPPPCSYPPVSSHPNQAPPAYPPVFPPPPAPVSSYPPAPYPPQPAVYPPPPYPPTTYPPAPYPGYPPY